MIEYDRVSILVKSHWSSSAIQSCQESSMIECHRVLSSHAYRVPQVWSSIDRHQALPSIEYELVSSIEYDMVWLGVVSYRCMSSIRYCQASSIVSYGWVSSMIECGMSSSLLQYPVSNIKYYVSSITKHGIKYGRVAMIKSWASSTMVEYWISSIIRSCQASVPSIGECHLQRSTLSDGRVSACMVSYQIWTSLIQYQAWYHVDECQVSFTMVEYCLVSSMEYPTWSSVIEYGVLLMIVENRVSSIEYHRVPSLI